MRAPGLILVFAAFGLSLAAATPALGDDSAAVATYREHIDLRQLESWLRFRGDSTDDPTHARDELVLVEVLAREAEATGLDRRPAVRWQLERADLDLIWPAVLRHALADPEISEDAVRALAARLQPLPKRVRLRNLFKRFPPDASAADKAVVRAEMNALLARLRAGEDFKALAEAESDSQTRLQQGLIGNASAGDLPPAIERVAFALQPGEVSKILEAADGLTLLYCEKILPAVQRTPEELEANARQRVENQTSRRLQAELEQALLERAEVSWSWPSDLTAELHTVVVTWLDGRLTVTDLAALVATYGTQRQLQDLPRPRVQTTVKAFLIRRMARLHARRLGLIDDRLAEKRRWTRRQILAGQALAERVAARFQPIADAELRRRFESERGENDHRELERLEHYQLRVIELPLDVDAPRASHDAAERLAHRLRRGELTFADAARKHSRHPSAGDGGRLEPWPMLRITNRLGIQVTRAVRSMAAGQTSRPVAGDDALWLLRLEAIEPRRPMTFEEARATLERILGQEQATRLEREITDSLLQSLAIREAGRGER
ncbi:MAG: peptidylprolyl isomerase [Acidobacteriota bacterium]